MAITARVNPYRPLSEQLRELEQTDPAVERAARSYHRTIERIIGRDLCPACGGLGWFRDEQGVTNCSCGAKT